MKIFDFFKFHVRRGLTNTARPPVPSERGIAETAQSSSGDCHIVHSHASERSILEEADSLLRFPPYQVGNRSRQATCSDVAWFRNNHLAVVNLYGQTLRIYRLKEDDEGKPLELVLLHEKRGLAAPEGVTVNFDGSLVAVSHSLSEEFGITIWPLGSNSLEPGEPRLARAGRAGCAVHGIAFSPDGRYLAYTVVGRAPSVEILRTDDLTTVCELSVFPSPLSPKSIAFSDDGRYALIAHGLNVSPKDPGLPHGGILTVHKFDRENGLLNVSPVAEYRPRWPQLNYVDMSTFLPTKEDQKYQILLAVQVEDRVERFVFDPQEMTISSAGPFLSQLSFPHGVAARVDRRQIAIAAYGNDTIHVADYSAVSFSAGD